MFRFSIFFLAYSALRYSWASPVGLVAVPTHLDPIKDAPYPEVYVQFTLDHNNQLRHRKLLDVPVPPKQMVMKKVPDKIDSSGNKVRKASPEEKMIIEDFLKKHARGGYRYKLNDEHNEFYDMLKPQNTLRYMYGRVDIFDENDYLIYSTPFVNLTEFPCCCTCDTPYECVCQLAMCFGCPVGSLVGLGCCLAIVDTCGQLIYKAGVNGVKWMQDNLPRAGESIKQAGLTANQSIRVFGTAAHGKIEAVRSTAAERIRETASNAMEGMRTATSRHSRIPGRYMQLSRSSETSMP
ncbi:hypothetical protein PGT21_025911 [Puccinia graminis f. sp. tritici]|nr:hypothetical protein PGT21_025911 [Puccinia graminis f. sp. tritici]